MLLLLGFLVDVYSSYLFSKSSPTASGVYFVTFILLQFMPLFLWKVFHDKGVFFDTVFTDMAVFFGVHIFLVFVIPYIFRNCRNKL